MSSSVPQEVVKVKRMQHRKEEEGLSGSASRRPPRMERARNEAVPEWKVKCLCAEYGVPVIIRGSLLIGGCF
ncbi:hypothetical protein MUK42_28464 [Musa troglodytarum]|uniref:Uncharacterized protein n=1 Tax=Musa troglodytarum TaxID=320322 RepID=A0A9E7F687_9LILI|nr:hypothetical protein MUK42_28464 [Musa troglodytarum]